MKKFAIAVTLIASLLGGCAASTQQSQKYAELAQQNQMIEQNHSRFDVVLERAYEKPQGDVKVFFADLGLDNVEIDEAFDTTARLRGDWTLTDKDKIKFQKMFADAAAVYFKEENGYHLVTEPEQADLIVAADITRIAPNAPKDDARSRDIGAKYFTEGSGSMTVVMDIYKDGQLVMKIEDQKDAGRVWERNIRVKNIHNTKVLFKNWMRYLTEVI